MYGRLKLMFISVGLILVFLGLSHFSAYSQEEKAEMVLGIYQKFQSHVLDEEFTYLVDLPVGYDKSDKKYPVLYVLNSHMISTYGNAYATLGRLSFEQIPQFILVGLCNEKGRARNYFPVRPNGQPGEADTLIKFLTDEFIPFIDQNYRTENYRILYGQSNTGLFAMYTLLVTPETFNAYIAASPGLGWCLDFMKDKAKKMFAEKRLLPGWLYMNYGSRDYKELVIEPTLEFADLLKEIVPSDFNWKLEFLENDGHVPVTSLNNGLLWLFPDFWISDEFKKNGLAVIDQHYETLTQKYGFKIKVSEETIFDMSYQLKKQQQLDESIAMITILLERYPTSARGYFFLGEVYREKGNIDKAKECYEKSLDLNPEFRAAKRRLEMLEKEDKSE